LKEESRVKPHEIVVKKLKRSSDEIIPLGYVMEQFSFDYINSNF
jgi:hypothetical protein